MRKARRKTLFLAPMLMVLAVLLAQTAAGATALRPPAGSPDPKLMVLTPADLHVKAKRQRYFKDPDFPSVISYQREFEGGRTGSVKLLATESLAEIGVSGETTSRFVAAARRYYSSKSARAELRRGFAEATEDPDFLLAQLQIGRVTNLGAGPGSFDLPMTVTVLGVRSSVHFAVFRVERVLGALFVVGAPRARLTIPVVARLAKALGSRMAKQLVPRSVAPPVVSGVVQVGQVLTASSGTWTGSPASATYQWQRCDGGGANCVSIEGATSQTYVPTQADAASTIRVLVTVANTFGSATAGSAPTVPVAAATGPTNTAPPVITGSAQVGQTLSATTGSWAGDPTSFGFQWEHCDASGNGCAATPGATSGTYVVAAADSGGTIRVAVTAANAAGSATTVSAPTTPVP
jgi:hypothetical protein